jgi:hypothetical protein
VHTALGRLALAPGGLSRRCLVAFAGTAAIVAAGAPVVAQTNTGPSKCVQCHDHERQAAKWQKEEPLAFKGKAHYATLKELDAPKAAGWAKAIGLADPYDLKGSCVKCHATVFRGDASAGVSCETCHGPASGYNEPHQQKGSYAQAVAAGMRDLRDKPAAIARLCVECHVLTDRRLAAAGHPTGEGFDAGASLRKLVHWTRSYDFAQVTAAGRMSAAGRAPAGGGAQPTVTAARPAAPASAAASAPPPAPWDWDQPVRPLPQDYVPEPVASAPAGGAAPAAEPRARVPRREETVPPSIAEDTPVPRGETDAATSPASPATAGGPRPRAAEVVELRGKGAALLERLLRAGARSPGAPAPARPLEFAGPDGELLRLQDEALALALEALRRP